MLPSPRQPCSPLLSYHARGFRLHDLLRPALRPALPRAAGRMVDQRLSCKNTKSPTDQEAPVLSHSTWSSSNDPVTLSTSHAADLMTNPSSPQAREADNG